MSKYHPSKRQGCQCDRCQSLCRREPGWFMPEEPQRVATRLQMPYAAFLAQYTQVHEVDGIEMRSPQQRRDGSCTFFTNGLCKIHDVKPFECRKVYGCEAPRRHSRIREEMVQRVKTFG